MGLKRRVKVWVCLALVLVLMSAGAAAQAVQARYPVLGKNYQWAIPFDDSMLLQDGTRYHQNLARASLGLALSAFRVHAAGREHWGVNIQKYMEELGFSGILLQQYDVEPAIDTIATAISMKRVGQADEATTAVAVAVSGGGYVDEWKSNFLIGTGLHHQGFDEAARKVADRLKAYLADHNITGRVKVWIAGYSRAAATSNRAAAILLNDGLVQPRDLYAYTFATPNVTRQANSARYSAIFNIIGSFDPVPLIPFDDWGFRRFGTDLYLPTQEADSDYVQRLEPTRTLYREMTGQDYWTSVSRNRTITNLLSTLGDAAKDTSVYTQGFQPLLMQLMDNKNSLVGMMTSTLSNLIGNRTLFQQSGRLLGNLWTTFSNAFGDTMLQQEGIGTNEWRSDTNVFVNLGQEHVPTGYLAWLMAYDEPGQLYTTSRYYRQIVFAGGREVRVLDGNGQEVLFFSLAQGKPRLAPGTALTLSPLGDAMAVTIPADVPYTLEITVEEDAPASLSVREGVIGNIRMNAMDAPSGSLKPGQSYHMALPRGFGQPYRLQGKSGSTLLQPADTVSLFSEAESNSSIKQLFDRNLRSALAVAALALLQTLFVMGVSIRAGRQVYRRRALRKEAGFSAIPAHRAPALIRRCSHRSHLPLKLAALGIAGIALALLGEGMLFLTSLLGSKRYITTGSAQLLVYFTELPQLLLVFMAAIPALAAAAQALLWRQGEGYRLRTSRLLAVSALVCFALLIAQMLFDPIAWFPLWVRIAAPVQVSLLIFSIFLIRRVLKHRERCGASG